MPRAGTRPRQPPIALASGSVLTQVGSAAGVPLHAARITRYEALIEPNLYRSLRKHKGLWVTHCVARHGARAQRTPTPKSRTRGPSLLRRPTRRVDARKLKSPPRNTRNGVTARSAQSLHGFPYGLAFQSSVHSYTLPARSAWPHLPSPVDDSLPTRFT